MPIKEKTIKEFFCDVCGNQISAEEAQQTIFCTKGFVGDGIRQSVVTIQDEMPYSHTAQSSILCYKCKAEYLKSALSEVNLRILKKES